MNGPLTTQASLRLDEKLRHLDDEFGAAHPWLRDRQRRWCSRCGATAVEGEVWQHATSCPAHPISGDKNFAQTPSAWMIDFDPETLTRTPARRDLGKRTSPHGDPLSDWENPRSVIELLPDVDAPLSRILYTTERWCVHCGAHQLASIEGPLPHVADCPSLAREEDPAWDVDDWMASPLSFRNYFAGCNFVKVVWVSPPPWAYDAVIVENGMGC